MTPPPAGSNPATDPKAEATRRQGEASNPATSAWVAANAGSGKTHVLAQRVIRLLLSGTPPGRILCLTYTKAAASNMANRVLSILGRWVALDDPALDTAIRQTDNRPVTPELRARARRLFAAALETPGGLKIQTIHAFCGGLLHRFPFEAGVAAGFRELDDAGRAELEARIRTGLVLDGTADPDGPLGRALLALMEEVSDMGIEELLSAAIDASAHMARLPEDAGGRRRAIARALGVSPSVSAAAVEREMLESPHLPASEWESAAAALAFRGKSTDAKRADALRAAAAARTDGERLAAYLDVFFKSDGDPRSDKDLATKAVQEAEPGLVARLVAERDRLATLKDALRAARVLERSEAALALGAEACARYAREKAARGLLDFDDLIARTGALLNRVPASFVHYKLDRGIDHVLVDEAQDTSPEQWRVVAGLVSDFFAGEGARSGVRRTLFVVGDEKQSIFSFQGADPRAFGTMHGVFEKAARTQGFSTVRLPHSFRSAPGVLEAVDRVFAGVEARSGLTADDEPPVHAAIRGEVPALVEIWPTVAAARRQQVDDWRRPLDAVTNDDPVAVLAGRIADFIRAGIAARLAIPSRGGRAMGAGDVLVLVRRRGKLFQAIIRALKEKRVDVAGADRLVVAEHIAALDLMALGDALLSPDDDLALACVLKSPLFGLTDDDLIALCPRRDGRLSSTFATRADEQPRWREAQGRLERWREEAARLRPFDFYGRVLGRDGGRRAMIARLGPEAADVLDEFMALARAYESTEAATLPGFLASLRRAGAEAKRDMESGRDEVRVMTVHGAKGLEAPLVILADTVDLPKPRTAGGLIRIPDGAGGEIPVMASRKADDPAGLAAARGAAAAREMEEYRRLLYVALTRAEDAVIVCGAETRPAAKDKPHARPAGCWYDLVHDALAPEAHAVPALGFEGEVLRWRSPGGLPLAAEGAGPADAEALPVLPTFTAPAAEAPRPLLRPSRRAAPPPATAAESAPGEIPPLVRGDLIHRLLAGLAPLADGSRADAGLRMLRHAASPLGAEAHDQLLAEALQVLRHPPLADLFGPGSRAEVPVVGRLADGERMVGVSGRIDRLAVTEDRLVLADFKTDRLSGRVPAAAEGAHVTQLALYGALLEQAFPGRFLEVRLVYTAGPLVHVIPAIRLRDALAATLTSVDGASRQRDAP